MREEKIVWMTWEEDVERYVCPHPRAAALVSLLLAAENTPGSRLVVVGAKPAQAISDINMRDVAEMLNWTTTFPSHEFDLIFDVLNDQRFTVCGSCLAKAAFENDGRWAIISRDTGEILRAGDQLFDKDRIQHILFAELAAKEGR